MKILLFYNGMIFLIFLNFKVKILNLENRYYVRHECIVLIIPSFLRMIQKIIFYINMIVKHYRKKGASLLLEVGQMSFCGYIIVNH